jgi:hypothetical protein
MGIPEWASTGVAPGLLGWFYLVGGIKYTVIGIVFFTVIAWIIWYLIARMKLYCLPIAQTLFLFQLFLISSEGTFNSLYLPALVILGSVTVCELLSRNYISTHPFMVRRMLFR